MTRIWLACLGAYLAVHSLAAQGVSGAVSPGLPRPPERPALPPGYAMDFQRPPTYRLSPLSTAERSRARSRRLPQKGVARAMPSQALRLATVATLPNGRRLWRASISSPGASGLRVHITHYNGGAGQVWIYTRVPDGGQPQVEGPFTGRGPFGDGDVWTGVLEADSVEIEYLESAPGTMRAFPPFKLESVVHTWSQAIFTMPAESDFPGAVLAQAIGIPRLFGERSPFQGEPSASIDGAEAGNTPAVAYCHLDAICYNTYKDIAPGIVRMEFQSDDGGEYVCTGAMIITRAGTLRPYMLTANHCISSNTEARSLISYFRYQTPSCGGAVPSLSGLNRIVGATYLVGAPISQGDYTLLLLSANAPAGTYYLGWNSSTTALAIGGSASGIHHPAGSYTRVSFGNRVDDRDSNVAGELAPSSLYWRVAWSEGKTEGGSSGSPLLNSNYQIIGTLTYGPKLPSGSTVCDIDPEISGYGRFSNTYTNGVRAFLEDTAPPSLSATPASMTFTVVGGRITGTASQTITIRTDSTTAVPYSLKLSQSWMRASVTSGNVTAAAPASVSITLDPTAFSRSTTATGAITISSGTLTPIGITVTANVTVSASKVTLSLNPNPVPQGITDADGYAWFYTLNLAETGGVATRVTSLKIAGSDYASSIVDWFGTDQLPAGGVLSASLRSRNLTVPVNRLFEAAGVDSPTGTAWNTSLTAPFQGRPTHAILTMDSAPAPIRQNASSTNCPWYQQLVLTETGGFAGTITDFTPSAGWSLNASLTDYWGTAALPANGSLRAGICWTGVTAPDAVTLQVTVVDTTGSTVRASASGNFTGPSANATTMSVSNSSVQLNAAANYTAAVSSNVSLTMGRNSAEWTGRLIFPNNANSDWLSVSPLSGSGSAALKVSAGLTRLAADTYSATLALHSIDAVPSVINIPLRFVVGASSTAPVLNPAGIVNNATYTAGAAPGMILSVFGSRLSNGAQAAASVPLPLTMQGTTATVNGRPAPLYYVSPGQINMQIPYETAPGTATLAITVAGQSASQQFQVSSTAPGIYTSDGRNIVPINQVARGGFGVLYVTGQGAVVPAVVTGAAPDPSTPIASLPAPLGSVGVTVGGIPARVTFAAIPYFLAGVIQVNYQLSGDTPSGVQPVVVRVGSNLSPAAYVFVP